LFQIRPATPAAICRDLVNPRTGTSDCPNVAYLCNNALYYNLMTQQCPRTCNRCPPGTVTPAPSTCQDLVDPRTGRSNCAQVASYCQNPLYLALMKQQCPRTCGYCP
ncbi:shTK domain protein, partial [Cooperia oncophora]